FHMLIHKKHFQIRKNFSQLKGYIIYAEDVFHQIVSTCSKRFFDEPGQNIYCLVDVDKRPALITIAIDGDAVAKVGFEQKTIDHRIETHAFAVAINISTPDDATILFFK